MLRRQKQKRHNKMILRRKTMPKRKPQQQNSAQIEQLLNALPTLAFEPELVDFRMDKSKLMELIENDIPEPNILMELLTEEFISELDQRLAKLEEEHSEKSIKHGLASATRHQLAESSKKTHLSNPVIVAIFLKTLSSHEGRELDLDGLPLAMKEFEQKNYEYFKQLTDEIQSGEKDESVSVEDNENHDETKLEKRISPLDEEVLKNFLDLLPEEKLERTEEDLEVFLADFQPPSLKEWEVSMIKHFFEDWFVENANPLKEDLDSMRESLLGLFKFLDREKLLPKDFFEQACVVLEK